MQMDHCSFFPPTVFGGGNGLARATGLLGVKFQIDEDCELKCLLGPCVENGTGKCSF